MKGLDDNMRRSLLSLCLAGLLTAIASAPAAAATLRIDFDDLDMTFDGDALTTEESVNGTFDALGTMDFFLDDVRIGSLPSNVFATLGIGGIGSIPSGGGPVSADYGLFTLITGSAFDSGISLWLDDITLSFTRFGTAQNPRLALAGVASATALIQEMLPFGVEFDPSEPLDLLFILNLTDVKIVDEAIVAFKGVGTGSLQGEGEASVVPEPASMILLGTGLIGVIGVRRRTNRNEAAA